MHELLDARVVPHALPGQMSERRERFLDEGAKDTGVALERCGVVEQVVVVERQQVERLERRVDRWQRPADLGRFDAGVVVGYVEGLHRRFPIANTSAPPPRRSDVCLARYSFTTAGGSTAA